MIVTRIPFLVHWRCSMLAFLCVLASVVACARAGAGQAAAPATIAGQYRTVAARIVDAALSDNDAYLKLQELCDDIGHRLSGSPELERATTWAAGRMRADGLDNVRLEPVMVPHWVRGDESLTMNSPRRHNMPMLGLGGSIGTPPEGLTAEIIVVADEQDLEAVGDQVEGKIVLFNNPMPPYDPEHGSGYGTAVRFRSKGAALAAAKGAVGCLVRSVTAHSLRSPHTGAMHPYDEDSHKIPAAAITTEDAEFINRLQARGIPVQVTLKMDAKHFEPAESANVVGELRGSTLPNEIVIVSGHLDSWDVGQGAHDDGGGCVIAMEALNVLKKLNLRPKRTIRAVLWTNEENGLKGAKTYVEAHQAELSDHVAAIESDGGAFRPLGFSLECEDPERQAAAAGQMREIMTLFASLGATQLKTGGSGADVGQLKPAGVVLLGHQVEMSRYFDYHHSPADTVDKVNPADLSKNVAMMAAVLYILADMPERLGEPTAKE